MSTENINSCVQVYEKMDLGAKKEDTSAAREWLTEHQLLGCWIDGKYLQPDSSITSEIILGEISCQVTEGHCGIETSFSSSVKAQSQYVEPLLQRQILLENVVKELQSNKTLFTSVYNLQCQKNDFDLFIDYFNFYSSVNDDIREWEPAGVVLIIISDITPPWFLAMASSAALWAGCSIIINPSPKASVFPFLLAEICSKVGLPNGLINVVPGSSDVTKKLCELKFDTIIFNGNYFQGCEINYMVPLEKLSLVIFGHTSFIIFESGDMDGALDKLFSENWGCSQQGEWAADLVVVQESIFKIFVKKLTSKLENINKNNYKLKYKNTKLNLSKILAEAEKIGVKVYGSKRTSGSDQILIPEYDLNVSEPGAPVTKLLAFKTVEDAVGIVNNQSFCIGTSIWTENVGEAMDVSSQLETCTKWVNCHGVMDASVSLEVLRKSGTGVFGGVDGGLAYMVYPTQNDRASQKIDVCATCSNELEGISQNSNSIFLKWKLNNCRKEYLMKVLDKIQLSVESDNLKSALSRTIRFWALNGNSYSMTVSHRKYNNIYPAQRKTPIGVIAMILNDYQENIETIVSWIAPAIIMGNVVIVVTPEEINPDNKHILKCFVENLPNGVVKIVEGIQHGKELVEDSTIQAVWIKDVRQSYYNINSSFKRYWSPPCPVPLKTKLFEKHCLKSQVIWLPTINCSDFTLEKRFVATFPYIHPCPKSAL